MGPYKACVGILLAATLASAGPLAGSLWVYAAPSSATVEVTDLLVTPTEVAPGEPVEVRVTILNTAPTAQEYEIELLVNNQRDRTRFGSLPGGASRVLLFTLLRSEPGTYAVRVGALAATFRVLDAGMVISDLTMTPRRVAPGDPVDVVALVTNKGASTGTFDVTLMVNGLPEGQRTGLLLPSESRRLLFQVPRRASGTYAVSLGSLSGSFAVSAPSVDLTVPREVPISPILSRAEDASGNPVALTGDRVVLRSAEGSNEIILELPVALAPGQGLRSFEDATSEVRVTETTVEVPLRDLTYNRTGAVVGKVGDVVGTGNAARVTVLSPRLTVKEIILEPSPGLGEGQARQLQVEIQLAGIPAGAHLQAMPLEQLTPQDWAWAEMALRPQGMTLTSMAMGARIDVSASNQGGDMDAAFLTFAVPAGWVEEQGGEQRIRAIRLGTQGDAEALPTSFVGVDAVGQRLFRATSPKVSSIFALVGVAPGPFLVVSSLEEMPALVQPGEPTQVVVRLTNNGGETRTETVLLNVDGQVAAGQPVTVEAEGAGAGSFTLVRQQARSYEVAAGEKSSSFRVARQIPSDALRLVEVKIEPEEVSPGEPVTVSALAVNSGEQGGTFVVDLLVNGALAQRREVYLGPASAQPLEFTLTRLLPGSYQVELHNVQARFTVSAPLLPADFQLAELSIAPRQVQPGQPVTISARLSNRGHQAGQFIAELQINGQVEEVQELVVDGLTSLPVVFQVSRREMGTYQVAVNDLVGEFQVILEAQPLRLVLGSLDIEPQLPSPGEQVTVTVTLRNEGEQMESGVLTVFVDGQQVGQEPVILEPGEKRALVFTTSKDQPGSYTVLAIHLQDDQERRLSFKSHFTVVPTASGASFQVSRLELLPQQVEAGEPVQVSFVVTNLGDLPGTFEAVVMVNDEVEARHRVAVEGLRAQTVEVEIKRWEPGSYQVSVDGLSSPFQVKAAEAPEIPRGLNLESLTVTPSTVSVGEVATVRIQVRNPWEMVVQGALALRVNGQEAEVRELTVEPGAERSVTFAVRRDEPGQYQIEVGELSTTLLVQPKRGVSAWVYGALAAGGLGILTVARYVVYRRHRAA